MKKHRIFDFDNGTDDRYTLINKDGEVFAFNANPFHPLGIGMYCGNINNWQIQTTDHLGKPISLESLPEPAQKFVRERL